MSVTVTDASGAAVLEQSSATVTNVPPQPNVVDDGSDGMTVRLRAVVADPSPAEAYQYAWTVTVDGVPLTGLTDDQSTLSFPRPSGGVARVILNAVDDDGGQGNAEVLFIGGRDQDDRIDIAPTADTTDDPTAVTVIFNGGPAIDTGPAIAILIATDAGNDTVTISSAVTIPVAVFAGAGDDFVVMGSGDDYLDGGSGDDTLVGGAGNDTLTSLGNDSLVGGAGDDLYLILGFSDKVLDESGADGNDTISFAAVDEGVTLDLGATDAPQTATDGGDTITLKGTFENVLGSGQTDNLSGNEEANLIFGGGGNDSLDGGVGNDTLDGGSGNDSLTGADGNDTLVSGDGNDSLDGGMGNDTLIAGEGNGDSTDTNEYGDDTLFGGDGNDLIFGGGGNDSLDGGAGNDTLSAGGGEDSLDAGTGDDTLMGGDGNDSLVGGDGNESLDGGMGNDTLIGSDGNDSLDGGMGDDTLYAGDGNDTTTATDDDTLFGGDGNDLIFGTGGANLIVGGEGDDRIVGRGQDRYFGDNVDGTGTGTDWFLYYADADLVLNNNSLTLGSTVIPLDGFEGVELTGGEHNNVLNASAFSGNVALVGGGGDDVLIGSIGNDTLDGGAGNDVLDGGAGSDVYNFGADAGGNDAINEAVNLDEDMLDFDAFTNGVTLDLGLTVAQIVGGNLTLTLNDPSGVEDVFGTAFADVIAGNDRSNRAHRPRRRGYPRRPGRRRHSAVRLHQARVSGFRLGDRLGRARLFAGGAECDRGPDGRRLRGV